MYKKTKVYILVSLIVVLGLLSIFFLQVTGSWYDEFVRDVDMCAKQTSSDVVPEKIAELNKMPFVAFTDLPTNISTTSEVSSISTDTGCILKTAYYSDDKTKPQIMLMVYPIKSSNNTVATFDEHWNCQNYDPSHAANIGFQSVCTSNLLTSGGNFGVNLMTTYDVARTKELTGQITVKD